MTRTPLAAAAAAPPAAPETHLWPASLQRSGAHVTPYGLGAFSSHGDYPTPAELAVFDSEHRLHLSVWLREGLDVETDGWKFRVESRDTVAGLLPGAPWQTDFDGRAHHVGLLLPTDVLHRLGGEQAGAFFERLRREGCLRVSPGDAAVLRSARELDGVLLAPQSSPLLREAKSLELLARLIEAGTRRERAGLTARVRARLEHAHRLLLADLAHAPTIAELARACGLNTFRLKTGFKEHFGAPIYTLYQQERMRTAWELIGSGRMSVSEAGHHLGYANLSHFSIAFRKAHGLLPGQLKRRACQMGFPNP